MPLKTRPVCNGFKRNHLKHGDYYLTGHRTWKKANGPAQAPLFFMLEIYFRINLNFTGRVEV